MDYIEKAEYYKQAKKYRKAFNLLKKSLKAGLDDIRTVNALGEISEILNRKKEIKYYYTKAGRYYKENGYVLKAISIYKKLYHLFPDDYLILYNLAELFRDMTIHSEAIKYYHLALEKVGKSDIKFIMEVLEKVISLQPENIIDRVKLGEFFLTLNQKTNAMKLFREAFYEAGRKELWNLYLKLGERILYLQPDDYEVSKKLAEVYVRQEKYVKALERLHLCLEIKEYDPELLGIIAEIFQKLEEKDKAILVLKEIVKLYKKDERKELLSDIYEKIISLDPSDFEAKEFFQSIKDIKEGESLEFDDFNEVTLVEKPNLDMIEEELDKKISQIERDQLSLDFGRKGEGIEEGDDTIIAQSYRIDEFALEKENIPPVLAAQLRELEFYISIGMKEEALGFAKKLKDKFPNHIHLIEEKEQNIKG